MPTIEELRNGLEAAKALEAEARQATSVTREALLIEMERDLETRGLKRGAKVRAFTKDGDDLGLFGLRSVYDGRYSLTKLRKDDTVGVRDAHLSAYRIEPAEPDAG